MAYQSPASKGKKKSALRGLFEYPTPPRPTNELSKRQKERLKKLGVLTPAERLRAERALDKMRAPRKGK